VTETEVGQRTDAELSVAGQRTDAGAAGAGQRIDAESTAGAGSVLGARRLAGGAGSSLRQRVVDRFGGPAVVRRRVWELVRFSLVGGAAFGIDMGGLVALHQWTGLPLPVDTATAFAASSLFTFVLSRQWVFPDAGRGRKAQAALVRYAGLVIFCLLLTTAVVPLLAATGLDYRLAKLVASGLVALTNFIVMPRWVFRESGQKPA
jgi:putative flippase GtrA